MWLTPHELNWIGGSNWCLFMKYSVPYTQTTHMTKDAVSARKKLILCCFCLFCFCFNLYVLFLQKILGIVLFTPVPFVYFLSLLSRLSHRKMRGEFKWVMIVGPAGHLGVRKPLPLDMNSRGLFAASPLPSPTRFYRTLPKGFSVKRRPAKYWLIHANLSLFFYLSFFRFFFLLMTNWEKWMYN